MTGMHYCDRLWESKHKSNNRVVESPQHLLGGTDENQENSTTKATLLRKLCYQKDLYLK
jgi:hypothetical protein